MAAEEITLDRILQVYREESRRKGLTSLEPDFWTKVRGYVGELEGELARETGRDPNSAKAALLRDELKKVLKRREQIWQYRERKMALMACSAAAGAAADTSPLTPVEVQAFQELMGVLDRGRQRAFGEGKEEAEELPEKLHASPEAKAPKAKRAKTSKRPREATLVRILEDIPPFMGLDVTYRLKKEDVVGLPPEVAQVLLEKGKAERIRPRL